MTVLDLWAIARIDLGLSDEEFGDLSYGLFDALMERWWQRERREYMRAGVVASVVANCLGRREGDPAITPMDFVPGEKREVDLDKLPPEEAARRMISMMGKRTVTRH